MEKHQHLFTIEQLEGAVFKHSKCYEDSIAFQLALEYIKKTNIVLYKDLLYKEALAGGFMGWLKPIVENLIDDVDNYELD